MPFYAIVNGLRWFRFYDDALWGFENNSCINDRSVIKWWSEGVFALKKNSFRSLWDWQTH